MISVTLLLTPLLALLQACGLGSPDEPPLVVAHRAAPAHWPENSRAAVEGSLDRGYPGIEIDIVLTSDHVPIVAHDPWLAPESCTHADGTEITERILVQDLAWKEIETGFVCGGLRDPSFPDAELVADSLMTLDELADAVRPYPDTWVQLYVKYEPGLTPGPEVFAEEVLSRWTRAGLQNSWYVSANLPELLLAFREWMDDAPITTVLIYPRFPPDSDSTLVGLGNEILSALGVRDALGLARKAEADGIAWPFELLDWHTASTARAEDLLVMVWTVNEESHLELFCDWPVDVIITDFPERAPCLPR